MVTDVVLDTRRVVPGALFCCVPGARVDGHDLAGKALDAGAAALCVQRPLDTEPPSWSSAPSGTPWPRWRPRSSGTPRTGSTWSG